MHACMHYSSIIIISLSKSTIITHDPSAGLHFFHHILMFPDIPWPLKLINLLSLHHAHSSCPLSLLYYLLSSRTLNAAIHLCSLLNPLNANSNSVVEVSCTCYLLPHTGLQYSWCSSSLSGMHNNSALFWMIFSYS